MKDEMDDLEKEEEEEKRLLLDYIKMQNEALKRIYKKAVENEDE